MMGVVLWSDLDDQKAVFWCEDHGDLAYYDAVAEGEHCVDLLNAGDMVCFDVTLDQKMRRASNAHVVEQKVCHGLQEHLRANSRKDAAGPDQSRKTGEVVQLRPTANRDTASRRIGRA